MSAPINTKVKECKPCPCGCGSMLYPYNDGMPLVCQATWKRVAAMDRKVIMLPGWSEAQKRGAVRHVMELARKIAAQRGEGAKDARGISDLRFQISKEGA